MRVTGETAAPATGRRVGELKAHGQDEGEHELEKHLAIVKQAKVGRFILKINGDGAVCSRRFGPLCPCVTPLSSGLVSG
jgi:hypothetical protein